MEYILTIDAGTSAMKTILWEQTGTPCAQASEELALLTPKPAFVELPVEKYWEVAGAGIRRVLSASGVDPRLVRVVSISSQGETLINLDKEGEALRNAIVWVDNRSTEEAALVEGEFGAELVYRITGQPEVVPTWPATKILWQKRHEPEVFRRTAKFLMLEDFLIYRLTGRYIGEYSVHSSTLWLDINRRGLWDDMLGFLGVGAEQFSDITASGELVGPICPEAIRQTGLAENTVVTTGLLDQAAGAIGSGNIESGICSETTGSALAACVLVPTSTIDPRYRIPCHCHGIKDSYYLMAWGQTAGMALKWFKDNFCEKAIEEAKEKGRDVYEVLGAEAQGARPGCDGLVFLPHLSGAACPEFNPFARGVFFGISLGHTRAHFVRAIMESVAYMLKANVDLLEKMGVRIQEVRSGGGGSRSPLWNRIKADVLSKPVVPVLVNESASAGAAIVAGTAVGMFSDLKEGCRSMVMLGPPVMPGLSDRSAYEAGYGTYRALYERLLPLFDGRS